MNIENARRFAGVIRGPARLSAGAVSRFSRLRAQNVAMASMKLGPYFLQRSWPIPSTDASRATVDGRV